MSNLSSNQSHSLTSTSNKTYYAILDSHKRLKRCCGSLKDVERVIQLNTDYTYELRYLSPPPDTVDVNHTTVLDLSLPEQRILKDSQLEPFNPTFHD